MDRREPGTWRDHVAMARPDHWIKHIFILPGIVLALILHSLDIRDLLPTIALGFLSAAALASANYVLNEWLDAGHDIHHPAKAQRPAAARRLSPAVVYAEYLLLAAVGVGLAMTISTLYLATALLFLANSLLYNVPPWRTKDRVVLDVLSESLNNPLRLLFGWAMVDSHTLPPSSLFLAYWMGGAFLMSIKRLAEFRSVSRQVGAEKLVLYRRSFARYSEKTLLLSAFLYCQMGAFFLAVFLIKYRIEYVLSMPAFVALFGVYFWLGLREESAAQTPEKLIRDRTLVLVVVVLILLLALLTWVDIPILDRLTAPHYIEL